MAAELNKAFFLTWSVAQLVLVGCPALALDIQFSSGRARQRTPLACTRPLRMAPAAHAAALALQSGPGVAGGTDLRDSWPAAWALRALRPHAVWRTALVAELDSAAGGVPNFLRIKRYQ